MTYMILEVHHSYVVALDESGRFIKAANTGQAVGDAVDAIIPFYTAEKKVLTPARIVSLGSVAAACCLVFFLSFYNANMRPFASVYFTVNPQLRMESSRSGNVLGVEALNADGEALLEGYDWKKKKIDRVSLDMVERSAQAGLLHEGGTVTLDIEVGREDWLDEQSEQLRGSLQEAVQGKGASLRVRDYDPNREDEPAAPLEQTNIPVPDITPPPATIAPSAPPYASSPVYDGDDDDNYDYDGDDGNDDRDDDYYADDDDDDDGGDGDYDDDDE